MSEGSSYRTILRSSSIMGAASVINILSSLVKMKVAAVLLGPAGVGLIGLYQNLMQTAATVSSLGLGTVGTRQIAEANADKDDARLAIVRRALFWGTLVLAGLGAFGFWLARDWIAGVILGDPLRSGDIAWLALGVALTVAAGSQGALLTGLRQIGNLARVQVGSGILGAALGVAALSIWGERGLLAMVLVAPVMTFLLGHYYVARLGSARRLVPFAALAAQWRVMAALGLAFTLSALVTTFGHLLVRILVQRELGIDALGQFQAAWAIGMTYLGFVLGAMAKDYYPRLTAVIRDHKAACRMVNEQTEVALLLCGPVLLAMLAAAPWVIQLLYSNAFAPAVDILRWQLLGDILKVMSWPLGFVLLAMGAGRTFVVTESIGIATFVLCVALGLPLFGVAATGMAFLALYMVYLPLVWSLARRRIGFSWGAPVLRQAGALIVAAISVDLLARLSPVMAAVAGIPLAALFALYAVARLGQMADLGGRIGRLARLSAKVMERIGIKV